ncbi:MAG: thiamine-phosphate kinase [Gammaproteobacteria bacterium]
MALSEFSIIDRFFHRGIREGGVVKLGVGDDCALLNIPAGYELAVTTDTMVENVHFLADADPASLGYKILAVNLSDLAAMGAKPVAVTMALTLPSGDERWLSEFARGFFELADRYSIDLIGGDTTSGGLSLTVQAMGLLPAGGALKRSTARQGDLIYLTGRLGDAGLGLKVVLGRYSGSVAGETLERFHRPSPRIEAGLIIRGYASACIDISDGLASDLGHILEMSRVGASVVWENLPFSRSVQCYVGATSDWQMPLCSGEDYELCFTVNPGKREAMERVLTEQGIAFSRIGVIEGTSGLYLERSGRKERLKLKGFEHFG